MKEQKIDLKEMNKDNNQGEIVIIKLMTVIRKLMFDLLMKRYGCRRRNYVNFIKRANQM